ncbi:hypothetical protein [uncultured Nocardioides sp.]|uniref:hypothetical protein n=1 Tax=uncultured Nocardioides sp. TaxID=198441 RepID=UPI0025DF3565|nr:hypothetical protein [uncultured Nocardioides sp.]
MSTPPPVPAAPAPSTPEDRRAEVAAELRSALRSLAAFGDGGSHAHEYAGGQLLAVLWGHPAHLCRSRCAANTGPFPCSPGIPSQLAGMTRRPVEGSVLLGPRAFEESRTLAQRVHFEYLREVAQPGIQTIWAWLARVVDEAGVRAVTEALADLAATHETQDRYAWHACSGWHVAVSAYGAHPAGLTVVTTQEATDAGYDPEEASPDDGVQQALAPDVRPFVVCDSAHPYARRAVSVLETARATRKYARLRGRSRSRPQ